MSPVIIQAASSPPVDPASRAMSAETMKMPEPIIEPTTIVVESNKPSPRTNPEESASTGSAAAVLDFISDTGLLRSPGFVAQALLPVRPLPPQLGRAASACDLQNRAARSGTSSKLQCQLRLRLRPKILGLGRRGQARRSDRESRPANPPPRDTLPPHARA